MAPGADSFERQEAQPCVTAHLQGKISVHAPLELDNAEALCFLPPKPAARWQAQLFAAELCMLGRALHGWNRIGLPAWFAKGLDPHLLQPGNCSPGRWQIPLRVSIHPAPAEAR